MTDDMTKRRDDLAEEICINPEFNTEDLFISEVLEMNRIWGFKEGFDACYKEMQANIVSAQMERNHFRKQFEEYEMMYNLEKQAALKAEQERDTLAQKLEIAILNLQTANTYLRDVMQLELKNISRTDGQPALLSDGFEIAKLIALNGYRDSVESLEQIKAMRSWPSEGGESGGVK